MKWTLSLATGEKLEGNADTIGDVEQYVDSGKPTLWLDIEQLDYKCDEFLERVFGCHPLAIEDCHQHKVRPKIEEYPNDLFIVFRGVNYNPGKADALNLYYFLGKNYILTVHDEPLRAIKDTMSSFAKSYQQLSHNPGKILYETLDRLVDNYFPLMDKLDADINRVETQIFFDFTDQAVEEIFELKKTVFKLKRRMAPQRDILDSLTSRKWDFIHEENFYHYRDVGDHIHRLADQLETYRELTVALLDSYVTQVSNRMNEIMKILSIVATVMLPLSLLTGIFGMNFTRIPGLEVVGGFWILMTSMLLAGVIMITYFKWKKWL